MKSLEELNQIRDAAKKAISLRTANGARRVVVGMATCGIAAGARPVMAAIAEELNMRNIHDVTVTMTGCIGVCRLEPIIEVYEEDGTKITYVKMSAEKAKRVVLEHLINGVVCQDLTIGAYES